MVLEKFCQKRYSINCVRYHDTYVVVSNLPVYRQGFTEHGLYSVTEHPNSIRDYSKTYIQILPPVQLLHCIVTVIVIVQTNNCNLSNNSSHPYCGCCINCECCNNCSFTIGACFTLVSIQQRRVSFFETIVFFCVTKCAMPQLLQLFVSESIVASNNFWQL